MFETQKAPRTINQLLDFVLGVKVRLTHEHSKGKLREIETLLKRMKTAPELHNNCSIDFKLENAEYYITQINNIVKNDKI